jgi:hypothetical protein
MCIKIANFPVASSLLFLVRSCSVQKLLLLPLAILSPLSCLPLPRPFPRAELFCSKAPAFAFSHPFPALRETFCDQIAVKKHSKTVKTQFKCNLLDYYTATYANFATFFQNPLIFF